MTAQVVAPAGASGERSSPLASLGAAGALVLLGLSLSGVTVTNAFSRPSSLKYATTVAVSVLLFTLVKSAKPLTIVVSAAIVTAPFATYGFTVGPLFLNLVQALLFLGVLSFVLKGPVTRFTWRGRITSLLVLALAVILCSTGRSADYFVWWLAYGVLFAILCIHVGRDEGGRRVLIWSVVAAAVVQAGIALWELQVGHGLWLYSDTGAGTAYGRDYFFGYEDTFRPTGAFSDPISLGNALALAVPLALMLLLQARRRWEMVISALSGALIVAALVVTLSRMSWMGAVAGILLVLLLKPDVSRRRLLTTVIFSLCAGVLVGVLTAGPDFYSRFDSISSPTAADVPTASGDEDRLAYWQASWNVFLEHPISGVGVGELLPLLAGTAPHVGTTTHAHSTYLQVAAEAGLLGLCALLFLLSRCYRGALDISDRTLRAGIAGSFLVLLVVSITDTTVRYVPVLITVVPVIALCLIPKTQHEHVTS